MENRQATKAGKNQQSRNVKEAIDPAREWDLVVAQSAPEGGTQPVEIRAQIG
jgi:hypothetical protein